MNSPASRSRDARTPARALLVALALAGAAGCASAPAPAPSAVEQRARTLNHDAARAHARGDQRRALKLYSDALAQAESIEDFDTAGADLLNLALVHAKLGEYPQAHARVDRILAAPARYGAELVSRAAARKALLFLDTGDRDAALRWSETALEGCAQPCRVAGAMADLQALVALERGDPQLAANHAARALAASVAVGDEAEQANAQRALGRAYTQLGRTDEAADALAAALRTDRRLGLPSRIALDLVYAAENEERRSRSDVARDYYERAAAVYTAAGDARNARRVADRLGALAAVPK